MMGSYIMIDPEGRFFDNHAGEHHYSKPILEVGVEEAFSSVYYDPVKFLVRGGSYDYRKNTIPDERGKPVRQ